MVVAEVRRLVLATLVVDVDTAVLVLCCTGRDHNSWVGGHPLNQSPRGAVFMILTACDFAAALPMCTASQQADSVLASALPLCLSHMGYNFPGLHGKSELP